MGEMQTKHLLVPLLTTLALTITTPGCAQDNCDEVSARTELQIRFEGFDRNQARRIEFESVVQGPAVNVEDVDFYDVRRGSMAFPAAARDGDLSLVVDPGTYTNALSGQGVIDYTLHIRVYGERGGEPNRLLAEGRYERTYRGEASCLLDQEVIVSARRTCANKPEGAACVGTGAAAGVCRGGTCTDSTCGDGYTDVASGELCDPATDPARCASNCLPFPQELTFDDLQSTFSSRIVAYDIGEPATPGYFSFAEPTQDASREITASVLAVDIDGDSEIETIIGVPAGEHPDQWRGQSGYVGVKDGPLYSDTSMGYSRMPQLMVGGPDATDHTPWFGARLAAGDLDGDGYVDLVIGSPGAGTGTGRLAAGQVHIIYGGPNGVILPTMSEAYYEVGSIPLFESETILQGDEGRIQQQSGDLLGYALAVGDFDGDGLEDLALSAPGRKTPALSAHGEVYVLRGIGERRVDATNRYNIGEIASVSFFSLHPHARLGIDLAAGDVDGDGVDDLVMGSTASDYRGGAIYVAFGGAAFFEPDAALESRFNLDGDIVPGSIPDHIVACTVELGSSVDGLGGTLAVGDLDGDGMAEIAATLGRRETSVPPGAVALFRGAAVTEARAQGRDLALASDAVILQGNPDHAFGAALAMRDLTGNGLADLAIGAPYYSYTTPTPEALTHAGAIYVLFGGTNVDWWTTPVSDIDVTVEQPSSPPRLAALRLLGGRSQGFLGAALSVSPNLGTFNPADPPRRALMVMEPARDGGQGEPRFTTWGLTLFELLPCGERTLCEWEAADPW